MKKGFVWVVLIGGLAILGIVWAGHHFTSQKSDAEIIREAQVDMMQQEQDEQARRAELMSKVLIAPVSCEGVTTGIVFNVLEGEPDPGKDWPDWTLMASAEEQDCIMDAFHKTNAHAFDIQGKGYNPEAPSINRSSNFISDLASAALWTEGIDYSEPDKSLTDLINGYYTERAESRVKPSLDY